MTGSVKLRMREVLTNTCSKEGRVYQTLEFEHDNNPQIYHYNVCINVRKILRNEGEISKETLP